MNTLIHVSSGHGADTETTHTAARKIPGLPRPGRGLTVVRRVTGLTVAAIGLPTLTALLIPFRDSLALESVLLLYMPAVVTVAVIGGVLPAIAAALTSVLLPNFFFTTPYHTLRVDQRDSVIALIVFVLVAMTVSIAVEFAARSRVAAARSRFEAEMLARFTAKPVTDDSLPVVLEQTTGNRTGHTRPGL